MSRRIRPGFPHLACALASLLAVPHLAAQELRVQFPVLGDAACGVAALDDLDGDGLPELALAEPDVSPPPYQGMKVGRITVRSSATGEVLFSVTGTQQYEWLGLAVASAGDQDGDGTCDLMAATFTPIGAPIVKILSGAGGATLHALSGPDHDGDVSLARLGDVDGDGVDELVVGTPFDYTAGSGTGSVRVWAGGSYALLYTASGDAPSDRFGGDVAAIPDLDGDGAPELAVAAGGGDSGGPGYVRVLSGRTGTPLGSVPVPVGGHVRIAHAGDVDADGTPDLVIGVRPITQPSYAVVHSGADFGKLLDLVPHIAHLHYGFEVAGLGDINLDGHDDLAVSNNTVPGGGGIEPDRIVLFSGADGSVLGELGHPGPQLGDVFGNEMAPLGDVTGDGLPDLLAGGRWFAGLVSCRIDAQPKPQKLWSTQAVLPNFGMLPVLAMAGDIDGDGREDVAVGTPFEAGTGVVRVYGGADGAVLLEAHGDTVNLQFGRAVTAAGDVDGDGRGDLFVGAPGEMFFGLNLGAVKLVSGADGAILRSYLGLQHWAGFGSSLACLGDPDGDGWPRLAIGAPYTEGPLSSCGALHVIESVDGHTVYALEGATVNASLGTTLATASDRDGDGLLELLVGSPYEMLDGQTTGAARLVSGATGDTLLTLKGPAVSGNFGGAVASAGDSDGDGVPDLLVADTAKDIVRILSGEDGATLHAHVPGKWTDTLGAAVAGSADVDGDGIPDYLVAAPHPLVPWGSYGEEFKPADGHVFVVSGRHDLVIATLRKGLDGDGFGGGVCLADVDGDGLADPVVLSFPLVPGSQQPSLAAYSVGRPWTVLPGALAGAGGAPSLTGLGKLEAGAQVAIVLADAAPSAPGRLVLGLAPLLAPFHGGVLYPTPLVAPAFASDAQGGAAWTGTWPPGLPPGQSLFVQAWLIDGTAPAGLAATNALQATGH